MESSGFDTATLAVRPVIGGALPAKPPRANPIAVADQAPNPGMDQSYAVVAAAPIVMTPEHHAAFGYQPDMGRAWTYDENIVKPFRGVMDIVWDEQNGSALPTAVLLYPCLFPLGAHPDYGQIMHNLHQYVYRYYNNNE